MEKDEHVTEVIFRKYKKKHGGDILAIFPYFFASNKFMDKDTVGCYEHMGQHGTGSYFRMMYEMTTPASEEEYKDLKKEMDSLGYNLKVVQKRNNLTRDFRYRVFASRNVTYVTPVKS